MFEQAFSEAQHGLQDDDDGMFEDAFEEAQQGRRAAEEAAMRFILGFDLHFGHLVQSQQI